MNWQKEFLEKKYLQYNTIDFIENDPIWIPHQFSMKENIEISGFLTAIISWGHRTLILKSAAQWMELLNNNPFEFIYSASEKDIQTLGKYYYRTFNGIDTCYFLRSLQRIYNEHGGLEQIFTDAFSVHHQMKDALIEFRKKFFEAEDPGRTSKHIADILKGASAKRLNMFLRWMVRKDNKGVDFGLWKDIPSSALYIPLDLHTGNTARKLGLLKRKQNDWKSVEELTAVLRDFDREDPVKYDFALFGLGIYEGGLF